MAEHGKGYVKSKEYYPEFWDKTKIITLYKASLLTREDYFDIVGEEPPSLITS